MKEFNLCITFDTDADPLIQNHKNSVTFKNLDYTLDKISNQISLIENKLNLKIPLSWFVRIDNQIKEIFGEYDWILNRYSKFWDVQLSKKNEIHWHAHIYEMINNQWSFPRNDEVFIRYIEDVYNYIKKNNPNFKCIRIGEAYMSNDIMNFLKKIGLKADSSSLPGRIRKDKEKIFDWSKSPNQPYFPSKKDYQSSSEVNEKFVEIPMNTIKTRCSYDKSYLLRYANLAFKNEVMQDGLKDYIKKNDLLVTVSHPYEFFNIFNNNTELMQGNLHSLEINLNNILKICKDLNKKVNFITINDIIRKFINE